MLPGQTLGSGRIPYEQERRSSYQGQRNPFTSVPSLRSPEDLVSTLLGWMSDRGRHEFFQYGSGLISDLRRHESRRILAAINSASSNNAVGPTATGNSAAPTVAVNYRPRTAASNQQHAESPVPQSRNYDYEEFQEQPFDPSQQLIPEYVSTSMTRHQSPGGSWLSPNAGALPNEEIPQSSLGYDDYHHIHGLRADLPLRNPPPLGRSSNQAMLNTADTSTPQLFNSIRTDEQGLHHRQTQFIFNNPNVQPPSRCKSRTKISCPESWLCKHAPFKSESEFRKHYMGDHEKPAEYFCKHCSFNTYRPEQFKRHHYQFHGQCKQETGCAQVEERPTQGDYGPRKCFHENCFEVYESVVDLLTCWINHCSG